MAFRSDNEVYANNSAAVTAPSGVELGDLLIIGVMASHEDCAALNLPSGFTHISEVAFVSWDGWERVAVGWKVADAADVTKSASSGTYSVVYNDAEMFIWMGCYSGRVASGILDCYSNTEYTTDDYTVRAASMTVATTGTDVVWFGYHWATAQTPSLPSGMNNRAIISNGREYRFYIADKPNQPTGATGNQDATLPDYNSDWKHAVMVGLKPEAAGGISIPLLNHLLLGD